MNSIQHIRLLTGDCRTLLKTLSDQSVQACVTSPPYWGLRDYGHADQIGLEETPQAYVETMRQVFAEVWRVLRDDGTVWLNIGDNYMASGGGAHKDWHANQGLSKSASRGGVPHASPFGISGKAPAKPKDLVGIPWLVAFALRDAGWYLRSDIIWHKPNPMPESVTDRPTKAHEYIFLLAKSKTYYYDSDAISEPFSAAMLAQIEAGYDGHSTKDFALGGAQDASETKRRILGRFGGSKGTKSGADGDRNDGGRANIELDKIGSNKRSVWTVTTKPYSGAHFATFPPDLIKPCILAGTKPGDVVLDPFGGSGTTGMVALELGRKAVLIELNPDYAQLCMERCNTTLGLPLKT